MAACGKPTDRFTRHLGRSCRTRPAAGLAGLLVWVAAALAHAAPLEDPILRRAVPDDGVIAITDYALREWGPEPVHYRIDPDRFGGGSVSVTDETGSPVPSQVDGRVLTFVAAVGNGRSATYRVVATESADGSTLLLSAHGDTIEIRNEHLAVRMPAPGRYDYPSGVAADAVPGPLSGWASASGRFMGGSRFRTERRIVAADFRVVRDGPALFEYQARYRFRPAGAYVLRLRLSPGMPLAVIAEEFDFGAAGAGEDLLLVDLHRGWDPAQVSVASSPTEFPPPQIRTWDFDAYLADRAGAPGRAAPVGGVGSPPRPPPPEPGALLTDTMVPGGQWGGNIGGIQVSGPTPGADHIGIVPLHVGSWRRTMALNVWQTRSAGIGVALPVSVRPLRWSLDIADDFSPFSTHEHDPGLPKSFGRRVWGLVSGADFHLAQARFGYIGLDRYKDWIVDYPEGDTRYPGVFYTPAHLKRLKAGIQQNPDREELGRWFLFSGRPRDAVRHAEEVIAGLDGGPARVAFAATGLAHYRQSEYHNFVLLAEDALASADLPPGLRRELRRRLALYANLMSEPDFNPRGAGVHLGNNNMTINRTLALGYFAGLLTDHPRHAYWMDRIERFLRFKFATQTSPDGAWIAAPNYQLYNPTRSMNVTQNVLRNLGVRDFSRQGYLFATLRYLAYLAVPDPRFANRRIIPGMGNSGNRLESIWGLGMAAVADRRPERAAFLRQAHLGAKDGDGMLAPTRAPWRMVHDAPGYLPYYLPYIEPATAPLETTLIPAYGAVFRHHYGPRETTLLLRAGMNWSHWDTDALNTIVYAKGAPLSPGTGYGYLTSPATENNGIYHNRVKVGRRDLQEVFGRVDGVVRDYGFGAHADYAVAERFYPGQLFQDGNAMSWRRHVMFLKSGDPEGANYFVLRDTFPGGAQRDKWWYWLNLGGADRISVDGKDFNAGEAPVNRNVDPGRMPSLTGRWLRMKSGYGVDSHFRFARRREVRVRMTLDYARQDGLEGNETKTQVEVPAGPGEDYLYLLYPARETDGLPQVQTLGSGVLRIRTAESTDTVFIGDESFDYRSGGIRFSGRSGVVRVFSDKVVLAVTSGSGEIGYRDFIVSGHGPFEHTVGIGALTPAVTRIPGGYEKTRQRIELQRGVTVEGEAPFDAELDGESIVIRTDGRARVLFVSQPEFITRPQLFIDGQEWMASWTDYPASGWGSYDETWKIGLSVPEGRHRLVIRDMEFPAAWTRQFEPELEGVEHSEF